MYEIIEWFRENPDVFGFFVATIIFAITVLLVTFRRIQLWVTLVLLVFSLICGITITNQNRFFNWLEGSPQESKQQEDNSIAS